MNEIEHGGVMVYQGCALSVLKSLPAASVHMAVTSPPYWNLRDYSNPPTPWPEVTYTPMAGLPPLMIPAMESALGLEPTPESYVAHLVLIFREVWRVLRPDGTLFLNIGDSYVTNPGNGRGETMIGGGLPYRGSRDKTGCGLPEKNLRCHSSISLAY